MDPLRDPPAKQADTRGLLFTPTLVSLAFAGILAPFYGRTGLKAMIDGLPKVVEKFSALEDQLGKVVKGVGGLTKQVSDDPSSLVWGNGRDKGSDKGKAGREGKPPA